MASRGLQGLTAITCGELLGHEKDGCDQSLRKPAIVGIGLKAPQLGGNKILPYKSIVLRQLPDPDIFTCTASGFVCATWLRSDTRQERRCSGFELGTGPS